MKVMREGASGKCRLGVSRAEDRAPKAVAGGRATKPQREAAGSRSSATSRRLPKYRLRTRRKRGDQVNPVAVAKPSVRVFLGSHHEIRNVRAFVAQAVDGCPVADDVILLASEVTANAVVHTASGRGGTFTVVVRPGNRVIRVEVHDGGSEASPGVRPSEDLASSGRGLGLVESLATRWGYLGGRDGRVVWFEAEWT